ncbi:MAG: hypothetical protein COX79_01025 [Candidatus Levybacteria bacterium CG_4_10_14_0_2_um_filter_36_16]|nr:MAG: hypothetical protein AUK12_03810 [Candidatus Levybacteria bacterium CG2_30_37_29]PIR78934.1 MAG: hypothetical protein COU26_03875 [Candidatus Levybacteria bacterium CG10_big_fil_rev_8_21_14_0_10_36_30]PIZ97723.1 MAG: hypothetical protein COX79_01025 [Candidatus Levybacteria bacterium CG_4_10_14_0_2_um_filter_36_16]
MLTNVRERFLQIRIRRDEKEIKIGFFITGIIIIILLANVVYLNFFLLKNKGVANTNISPRKSSVDTIIPSPTQIQAQNQTLSPTPIPPTIAIQNTYRTTTSNTIKDYFIPLGSGTNQSSDWVDVPGAQVAIDLGQYQNVKEVHFEASVTMPTSNGSVYVRLFNVTDKHPVWNSDVSGVGNSIYTLTSPAIIYDKSAKVYQVQMKTQMQVAANLTQSRIHVTLE